MENIFCLIYFTGESNSMAITINMFFRDTLRRHYNLGCNYLEVAVNDVASFDSELAEQLLKSPSEYIPIVSK